jgi:hypothetical protein
MLCVSCISYPCLCSCAVPEFWQVAISVKAAPTALSNKHIETSDTREREKDGTYRAFSNSSSFTKACPYCFTFTSFPSPNRTSPLLLCSDPGVNLLMSLTMRSVVPESIATRLREGFRIVVSRATAVNAVAAQH